MRLSNAFIALLIALSSTHTYAGCSDSFGCGRSERDTPAFTGSREMAEENGRMERNIDTLLRNAQGNKYLISLIEKSQASWGEYIQAEYRIPMMAMGVKGISLDCQIMEANVRNERLERYIKCLEAKKAALCWRP